jgi:ferredoxin
MATRIRIDSDICVGAGNCALTAPEVFTTNDGFGAVIPGKEHAADDPRTTEAARACPVQAITLDRD